MSSIVDKLKWTIYKKRNVSFKPSVQYFWLRKLGAPCFFLLVVANSWTWPNIHTRMAQSETFSQIFLAMVASLLYVSGCYRFHRLTDSRLPGTFYLLNIVYSLWSHHTIVHIQPSQYYLISMCVHSVLHDCMKLAVSLPHQLVSCISSFF